MDPFDSNLFSFDNENNEQEEETGFYNVILLLLSGFKFNLIFKLSLKKGWLVQRWNIIFS